MSQSPCVFTVGNYSTDTSIMPCLNTTQKTIVPLQTNTTRQTIFYVLSTLFVAVAMTGIGATVHYKVLWQYIRNPKAYLLGVAIQLLLVPPLAWGLSKAFQMPQAEGLGVVIQGSCPGGTISNIIVYFMDGVVDLSVAMTATSTMLALGTMPLWLFIVSKAEDLPQSLSIPFERLVITLSCLVVPVVIGMIIKWKCPKKAPLISRILIIVGSLLIIANVIANSVLSKVPWIVTWRQGVSAAIMPFIAFLLGYLVSMVPCAKLNSKCRRTIALETSLQNVQVATTVIQVSFSSNIPILVQMLLFPVLYGVFQIGYSVIFCLSFTFAKRRGWVKTVEVTDSSSNEDIEKVDTKGTENPAFDEEINRQNYL